MAILSTDLVWYSSTTQGVAGGTLPWSGPGTSLGKYISTTPIVDSTVENLFKNVAGDENVSSLTTYQCVFIANNNFSIKLTGAVVWIVAKVTSGTTISIAKDVIGPVSISSLSAQADQIPLPTVAPKQVGIFSTPLTKNSGIPLGDIGPGQCAAVWIARNANNTPALLSDGVTLRIEGGTTP